jgi:hypothetical protein
MSETNTAIQFNDIARTEGSSLILKVGEYLLTLKIEGPEVKPIGRLQLDRGKTLFDLVLEAARKFVEDTGEEEFTAAALYHIAKNIHPDLDIRRNSWNSHVISCAPNHPSYRHYTSHREYFNYLEEGRYSLLPHYMDTGVRQ